MVVNKSLKDANLEIKRVGEVVRYIRNSSVRLRKFREYSDLVGIDYKSSLLLDVSTR